MHIHTTEGDKIATNIQQDQPMAANGMIFMSGSGPTNGGDVFDGSAEPIIYMSDNRMPVMIEFNSAIIYIIFSALFLALLSILPGVRKTKFTSFIGIMTILLVGASILLAIQGSYWLMGEIELHEAPYGALTSESITGRLEVNIGLSSTNVTLIGRLMSANYDSGTHHNQTTSKTVDYNERFHWDRPDRMALEHVEALRKGLPYPILTITEFLSQDSEGFNWMRQLRQAGYYASLALYASLASWCLTTVVMCVLPIYSPHMMQITGALIMSSVWIYTLLIQSPNSFVVHLGGNPVEFAFGYTYVTTFVAGALSVFAGILLFVLRMGKPHKQFTIMDSEKYLKDQNALHRGSLDGANRKTGLKDKPTQNRQDNVIIPIADIEQKFKPASV